MWFGNVKRTSEEMDGTLKTFWAISWCKSLPSNLGVPLALLSWSFHFFCSFGECSLHILRSPWVQSILSIWSIIRLNLWLRCAFIFSSSSNLLSFFTSLANFLASCFFCSSIDSESSTLSSNFLINSSFSTFCRLLESISRLVASNFCSVSSCSWLNLKNDYEWFSKTFRNTNSKQQNG